MNKEDKKVENFNNPLIAEKINQMELQLKGFRDGKQQVDLTDKILNG